VFTSFFPVALSAATGLANADANAVRLCQSLGASTLQIFLRVRIPFALPHLFAGMKVAATLVVIGVVIGEFISSSSGLGYFILNAGARSETARVFAGLIALSLFGLAFYGLIALAEYLARRAWQ
jgi:NitT/TauT family transport system permease protein